jgi:hypothetical protein
MRACRGDDSVDDVVIALDPAALWLPFPMQNPPGYLFGSDSEPHSGNSHAGQAKPESSKLTAVEAQ